MIRVRDCQIATSVRGDIMPTVILCHSTGMGSMQWARIARGLAPRRCVMPDWLGYGKSDTVSDGAKDWTIDLDALLALIDAEESPVDLVGHSYGGFLALRAALRRPDRVRRLVVHEPVVWETLRTAGDRDHHEAFEAICTSLNAVPRGGEVWLQGFVDFWNGAGAWQALPPSRADVWRNNSAVISAEVHCLIDDETPYTAWAALNMPVLVTVGTATTPIEAHVCDVLQRAIPGSALTSVPGGHMAPVSKGRSWMDAALPFLA
ncbi:MAG: pimeloyl-ACP methyl ester carboxylesterase [Myxococcota bacterium]|jgi:pimeloyl-ACP methyl ester carboxylesterase